MSAQQSTRSPRGGTSTRGGRATQNQFTRGRGTTRGSANLRGRGRGSSAVGANENATGESHGSEGLLQRLRTGNLKRGAENSTTTPGRGRGAGKATPFTPGSRGRGRGFANNSKNFSSPKPQTSRPSSRNASPVPPTHRDFMNSKFNEFQVLKQSREEERAKAIRDGFLADPDKKTSLDKAITPVGTCTDMCPRFERVERIVQNMVDRAEKEHDEDTDKDVPAEDRMVKRFRRSAAGYDEQLPSDIRTPATLKQTLDYLLDTVIGGGERLATIQKFVWDRTRGIRNDFSIQQVTNIPDVKVAVECFERIARFHILSLHQLSNPDNLLEGEHFDAFQEREQLNNTLLSLMFYYDDHGDRIDFPNEAEFRAYLIILEISAQRPDMEDRMQSWSDKVLQDQRVKTALKLYSAAGNTMQPQGPLQPFEPFAIAQGNTGNFWAMLASRSVPYIMACLAEMYFAEIRFTALDALWRSCKQGPQAQQAKSRDWSLSEVTGFLGFDSEDETIEFCEALDVSFATDENDDEYLDLTANTAKFLDKSSAPRQQIFSHKYVEKKRYHRTLTAVINGMTVADAIRSNSTETGDDQGHAEYDGEEDDQSLFVPESKSTIVSPASGGFGSSLNPQASSFTPGFGNSATSWSFGQPSSPSPFSKPVDPAPTAATNFPAAPQPKTGFGFGTQPTSGSFGAPAGPAPLRATFGNPPSFGSVGLEASGSASPFNTTASEQPPKTTTSVFGGSTATADSSPFKFPVAGQGPNEKKPFSFAGLSTPKESAPAPTTSQPAALIFGQTPLVPPGAASTTSGDSFLVQKSSAQVPIPSAQGIGHKPTTPTFTPKPSEFPSFQPPSTSTVQPAGSKLPSSSLSVPSTAIPSQLAHTTSGPSSLPTLAPAQSSTPPQPNADLLKPTVTPGHTPKTSLESFQFPTAIPPFAPLNNQVIEKPTATPALPLAPSSTTPPGSPHQPPAKRAFTQKDRDNLARTVAHIGFTQSNGLLDSFVEFALRALLTTAVSQHKQELRLAAIASIRERILTRKFAYLWRARAWVKNLNRRAKSRRQLFAETIRAEQARKQRSEQELEEILKASEESKRLQKEVQEASKALRHNLDASNGIEVGKLAGQKRKSFSGQDLRANTSSSMRKPPSSSNHKRSKTMSNSSEPAATSFRASVSQPQHVSIFARASVNGRSSVSSELRKSKSAQKLDATRTDYFRLKAMGIDPETSIIPDTRETLQLRYRREAEERQASIDRAKLRARSSVTTHSSTLVMPPPPVPQSQITETRPRSNTMSPAPGVEDDFLKQIREAREAMAEQTEWFKHQSNVLDKEIEREEEFRKSQSSLDGGSPLSSSGLAKINGYEFIPAATKPGFSLSRTEQRIRRTGAHGLATKPLRSRSEYVPVAMSKRSALEYGGESNSSPGRKRSHDDVESFDSEDAHLTNTMPVSKRARGGRGSSQSAVHQKLKPINRNGGRNPFQALQSIPAEADDEGLGDVGEDEEHDTEELYDEEEEIAVAAYQNYPRGPNGAYQDNEDEDDEDDLDEEDDENGYSGVLGPAGEGDEDEDEDEEDDLEEDDEDDEEPHYQYPKPYSHAGEDGYGADAGTPMTNAQVSRAASSAPGGSVDDAFVIDDSD